MLKISEAFETKDQIEGLTHAKYYADDQASSEIKQAFRKNLIKKEL